MAYEEMKKWGFARQRRKAIKEGRVYDEVNAKLVSLSFQLDRVDLVITDLVARGAVVQLCLHVHVSGV
jgi:hypothetical protein